jgi:Protein of unknown function (DUF1643)
VTTTASALLQRFEVFGRFYEAVFDGQRRPLRSHLEIVDRGLAGDGRPWRRDADLLAVMMNPGASRPVTTPDQEGWSLAVPDRTQYQLMKLALHAQRTGWALRHIRVINLSDLRTPKSAELFETLASLRDDRHSIFAAARSAELAAALGADTPVLRAWGMNPALDQLATRAVSNTCNREVLGLTDNGVRYRHPLPQRADLQQQWLAQMGAQVESMSAAR